MADEQIPVLEPHVARVEKTVTTLSGLPIWAQTVSVIGFPILVAMYFLAKEAGYIPSLAEANAGLIADMNHQHHNMIQSTNELVRLSREICRHTAKTDYDAQRCFPQ